LGVRVEEVESLPGPSGRQASRILIERGKKEEVFFSLRILSSFFLPFACKEKGGKTL